MADQPARRAAFSGRDATILILATASLVVMPFVFWGYPNGHDLPFHIASWMDVARQWREGVWFPRWAAWANYGFGEPRFIFYPPVSWMLGAALSLLMPWKMVPGAFIWLALTAAGICMFRLAREQLTAKDAMLAAILYAANPYHLIVVYQRSALAELLASAVFPLVVFFLVRTAVRGWHAVAPLAFLFGAVWLMNAPAGLITTYSLALMILVLAAVRREPLVLVRALSALALGFALAAFYLVPVAVEQSWANLSVILSPGLRPEENFLFATNNDAESLPFNGMVSTVAAIQIAVLAIAAVVCRKRRPDLPEYWWMLLLLAAGSTALMLPQSAPLWSYLPRLRLVQFPWRWLIPLNAAFAWFLVVALGRARRRTVSWMMTLAVLIAGGAWARREMPWGANLIPWVQAEMEQLHGYWSLGEYAPQGSNPRALPSGAPEVALAGNAPAGSTPKPSGEAQRPQPDLSGVHIEQWTAESKVFKVETPSPATATLRLLDYPAWRVEVNGQAGQARARAVTGEMVIPLPAGQSRVRVTFGRTRDRTLGGLVSIFAAAILLWFAVGGTRCAFWCKARTGPAKAGPYGRTVLRRARLQPGRSVVP